MLLMILALFVAFLKMLTILLVGVTCFVMLPLMAVMVNDDVMEKKEKKVGRHQRSSSEQDEYMQELVQKFRGRNIVVPASFTQRLRGSYANG